MKGLYVTANDLNKLYSSDIPVLITNNFAIIMVKRSGGEVFPPMGQMIPSMGNFRNQKSHTGHKWRYADQILKTGCKQKKTTFFTTCFQPFEHLG